MTQENEQIRAEIEQRHTVDSPTVEKQYDYETGAEQGLDEMLQVCVYMLFIGVTWFYSYDYESAHSALLLVLIKCEY